MTVLIIGGAYQGKRKVAENLYADLPRIENLHEIVRKMLCCALAQKADAVVRVIAGVPQFIKGEQP